MGASHRRDVVIVGAGQAGLATAFYLRRAGLDLSRQVAILDASEVAGGSWQRMWRSLRLFSPPSYSSLPGWPMPPAEQTYPSASHVAEYLRHYEYRYDLPVQRPARVTDIGRRGDGFEVSVQTASGERQWSAPHVVSATGTWTRPFVPALPGSADFAGRQLHSTGYTQASDFSGRRVLVVGGGNTGAQLCADLAGVAQVTWATLRPPRFLPDDVDGRRLFEVATARKRALEAGLADDGGVAGLGDVVVTAAVHAARDAGLLRPVPMFTRLTRDGARWADGSTLEVDVVLWCTGFRPELRHLRGLRLPLEEGRPRVAGTASIDAPGLHLVGYGDWTGPGSATLIGVGATAKAAAATIAADLGVDRRRVSSRVSPSAR